MICRWPSVFHLLKGCRLIRPWPSVFHLLKGCCVICRCPSVFHLLKGCRVIRRWPSVFHLLKGCRAIRPWPSVFHLLKGCRVICRWQCVSTGNLTNDRRRIDWNNIYGCTCWKEAQKKGDVPLVSACQYIVISSFCEHILSIVNEDSVDKTKRN